MRFTLASTLRRKWTHSALRPARKNSSIFFIKTLDQIIISLCLMMGLAHVLHRWSNHIFNDTIDPKEGFIEILVPLSPLSQLEIEILSNLQLLFIYQAIMIMDWNLGKNYATEDGVTLEWRRKKIPWHSWWWNSATPDDRGEKITTPLQGCGDVVTPQYLRVVVQKCILQILEGFSNPSSVGLWTFSGWLYTPPTSEI